MVNVATNTPWESGSAEENAWISDIYARHGDQSRRSALNIVGQIRDAENVLQESFLKLLRRRRKGPIRHPFAYLNAVVRTTSLDLLAKRRAEQTARAAVIEAWNQEQGDPSEPLRDKELSDQLDEAIGRLEPRFAKVVIARYLNDKSYGQIAEEMGISPTTARVYRWRALRELQRIFYRD